MSRSEVASFSLSLKVLTLKPLANAGKEKEGRVKRKAPANEEGLHSIQKLGWKRGVRTGCVNLNKTRKMGSSTLEQPRLGTRHPGKGGIARVGKEGTGGGGEEGRKDEFSPLGEGFLFLEGSLLRRKVQERRTLADCFQGGARRRVVGQLFS